MSEETISEINFFEIEDGEKFCLQQTNFDGEIEDEIVMERHVAIELAYEILSIYEEYDEGA